MIQKYSKLFTPLSYLRLRSPQLSVFQWVLPSLFACLAVVGFYLLPIRPTLFGDHGLVSSMGTLLSTLVGFYIAALAAIATFPSDALNEVMKGQAPTLVIRRQGIVVEEVLTRRRFLVVLFGYCAFVSIILFGIGVISTSIAPSFLGRSLVPLMRGVWLVVYFWLNASLLVTTLLGLHYLIDRMHRL